MTPIGLLTPADAAFFAAHCSALATYRKANRQIRELGELVLDATGMTVRNPWLRVRAEAAAEMRQFGCEFGLSPSRARTGNLASDGKDKDDPAAKYLT